jgi:hypothetical protein
MPHSPHAGIEMIRRTLSNLNPWHIVWHYRLFLTGRNRARLSAANDGQ